MRTMKQMKVQNRMNGGVATRRAVLLISLVGLLLVHSAYAHLSVVQARKLTVRGQPAVQLLIQTDQGAGREIIVQVGTNVITFQTDPRGRLDTGHLQIPTGATAVQIQMPKPGDELWPANCTIPLEQIPQNEFKRVEACLDLEPPITRFAQSPGKNSFGWNNSSVTVTLEASDAQSGVRQLCWELSGAQLQSLRCVAGSRTSFPIGTSPNGTTTVRFFAEDNWVDQGQLRPNRESPKSAEVRIDTGAPSISGSLSPSPTRYGWNNSPVRVSFSCSDGLSGIASCSGESTLSREGAGQTVRGFAEDRAGNTNSTTVTVNIDLTKPIIRQAGSGACSQPGNAGWCRGEITVPFEAQDNLSGFPPDGQRTLSFTRSTSEEGAEVRVSSGTIEDRAGNAANPISAGPFKLDRTPPVPRFRLSSTEGVEVVVTWTIEDALSGVDPASCQILLSGPGFNDRQLSTSCQGEATLRSADLGAGTFVVRGRARDLAGNAGGDSAGFTLVAPHCAITGRVVDATNNRPIARATVRLSPPGRSTTTDSDGRFSFTELAPGTYTVSAEVSGFSASSRSVNCEAGRTAEVVLALSPLGNWRIVLTWGRDPEDLDSHLWTPDGEHIWYGHMAGRNADLDVDDTTSFGPETITIRKLVEGTYVYAIKHYSGSGTLAGSGAKVDVFNPTGLVRSFTNPPCTTGKGSWWVVFKLHVRSSGVEIESVNKCLSSFDEESPTPPNP